MPDVQVYLLLFSLSFSNFFTGGITFLFFIAVPPTIIVGLPESTIVERGHLANLTCLAAADPPPRYAWTVDGQQADGSVELVNGNKSLLLRDVNVDDNGVYSCLATNEAGNISTQTNLTVHGEYESHTRLSLYRKHSCANSIFFICARGFWLAQLHCNGCW